MEWIMEDKMGDFHYFKDKKEISQYLNIPVSKVSAIIIYSRNRQSYSPSQRVYIQRLFINPSLPPRDRFKIKFNKWAKYYFYPNIND